MMACITNIQRTHEVTPTGKSGCESVKNAGKGPPWTYHHQSAGNAAAQTTSITSGRTQNPRPWIAELRRRNHHPKTGIKSFFWRGSTPSTAAVQGLKGRYRYQHHTKMARFTCVPMNAPSIAKTSSNKNVAKLKGTLLRDTSAGTVKSGMPSLSSVARVHSSGEMNGPCESIPQALAYLPKDWDTSVK
jgi:hypothetical protein